MEADSTAIGRQAREYFEKHFDKKKLMDEMDGYFGLKATHTSS